MTDNEIAKIVAELTKALEMRDYEKFVSFFEDGAIFEIPFAIDGGTILAGLAKIREHFEIISKSPFAKLLQINSVVANHFCATNNMVTIEYFM